MVHYFPPEFEYEQSTGCFYLVDREDGRSLIARGYAGKGPGLNDPEAEQIRKLGPLPRGVWRICAPISHTRLGPTSFALDFEAGSPPYGRDDFWIHGDNRKGDFSASEGCIILPLGARNFIRACLVAGVERLTVVR